MQGKIDGKGGAPESLVIIVKPCGRSRVTETGGFFETGHNRRDITEK